MEMIHQTEESTNHEHQSELAVKEKFQTNPEVFTNFKTYIYLKHSRHSKFRSWQSKIIINQHEDDDGDDDAVVGDKRSYLRLE